MASVVGVGLSVRATWETSLGSFLGDSPPELASVDGDESELAAVVEDVNSALVVAADSVSFASFGTTGDVSDWPVVVGTISWASALDDCGGLPPSVDAPEELRDEAGDDAPAVSG